MKGFVLAAMVSLGLGSSALAWASGATGQDSQGSESAPVETGKRPQMGEVQELEHRQREQYEALEKKVGVEPQPPLAPMEGTGGSGRAGTSPAAFEACAKALGEVEPITLVSGEVQKVSKDILTVEDAYGRSVRLSANAETCAMRAGQPINLAELPEGTAVRASYDIENERMTARVVRVIESQAREQGPRPTPQQQER